MNNTEVFEEAKKRIDIACEAKDFNLLDLSDLGFEKEDIKDGRLIHYLFSLDVDTENKIEIDFRCYDQSGPFQNASDMNKFVVQLKGKDKIIESYQNSYED
ncbi:hypothetical protein [Pedobacter sp. Leaf170]|uniref:hypothetical protein n=1 Tax=Pedobacter sp. Leaf170 TaxID=2876558 RepID=UPI001E503899|nr:hypothetical protein [Pedobacter sp. Leaf170]